MELFKYKSPNFHKLKAYGFSDTDGVFTYVTEILDGQFKMSVSVTNCGEVAAEVIDTASDEPYTLHLVAEACGAFVGKVRAEYERVLLDVLEKCFEPDVFKDAISHELIRYVRETYGDELEFLWAKVPAGAIWRRKDNRKWYGLLMTIPKNRIAEGDGEITVIDFRINPETDAGFVDGKHYFAGYHMNKRTWMTVILDGSVSVDEIKEWINKSYILAKGK